MGTEGRKKFLINFGYVAVLGILIYLAAKFLIGYLLPFIVAVIIAFSMQKPAEMLSKKVGIKKGILSVLLSVLLYLIVAFLAVFLIYRLSLFLASLTDVLPDIFEKISGLFNVLNDKFTGKFDFSLEAFLKSTLQNALTVISNFITTAVANIAKGAPSFLFSSIVALVATCYIAKDFDRLIKFVKEVSGKKITSNIIKIKTIFVESVFKFIKGYLILSGITFLEVFIGLTVLRVKNAVLIAVLIALVDILPVLGTGTVLIPWSVSSALFGNISFAIEIGILYITVVLLRNFLEPKIIGTQIGINPLFTLLAMFVGLRIFGVIGLFTFPVILIVTVKFYKE